MHVMKIYAHQRSNVYQLRLLRVIIITLNEAIPLLGLSKRTTNMNNKISSLIILFNKVKGTKNFSFIHCQRFYLIFTTVISLEDKVS